MVFPRLFSQRSSTRRSTTTSSSSHPMLMVTLEPGGGHVDQQQVTRLWRHRLLGVSPTTRITSSRVTNRPLSSPYVIRNPRRLPLRWSPWRARPQVVDHTRTVAGAGGAGAASTTTRCRGTAPCTSTTSSNRTSCCPGPGTSTSTSADPWQWLHNGDVSSSSGETSCRSCERVVT